VLLSGDRPAQAAAVAAAAGLDAAEGGLTPQDKAARLEALRAAGHRSLMIGDGLNDAAAVATADVSVALASGVDATRAAADMILTGGDLGALPRALHLARAARRRILENFGLAFLYNILAVPLAVSGQVTPLLAAIAMSTSSILVSLNALRLPGRTRASAREAGRGVARAAGRAAERGTVRGAARAEAPAQRAARA